jgi:Ca-activated chloride channel family protein
MKDVIRITAAVGALTLAAACGSGTPGQRPATLRVLAGSELADLRPILDQARRDTGVTVELDYTGTLTGGQQVLNGQAGARHDAVWFSSNRYLALRPQAQAKLSPSVKIMSSPVVLGLRTSAAHRLGWDHTSPTWADIAMAAGQKRFSYGMTNPASSNSGFSALVAVTAGLSGDGAALDASGIEHVAPRLQRFFASQALTAGSSGWLSETYARRATQVDGLINYESVLLALNASRRLPEPLTVVYPRDGVVTADYPITLLSSASGQAREAFRKLAAYHQRPEIQRRIMATTHRRPASAQVPPGSEFGPLPPELPFPARPDAVEALVGAYADRFRRPTRTLYVLDVSASMKGERIASLKTALTALSGAGSSHAGRLQRFHNREEVTLIPFNSTPQKPVTYSVPGTGPQAELGRIRTYAQSLTARGGTAMYDGLEKAHEVAGRQAARDPDRFTSIVLMSDGESTGGTSAASFRAWFARQPAALRQIPIFPILFGEAAARPMNQLAELTQGRTFDARRHSLPSVFAEIRGYQ